MQVWLTRIERLGNRLPHPVLLFFYLTWIVIGISWWAEGMQAALPGRDLTDRDPIVVRNLMDDAWLRQWLAGAVGYFTGFAPLGTVLVAMLGIGIAEGSGLVSALVRRLVLGVSSRRVTAALILAGIVSHSAADAGYVLVIPLGALIFASSGRHPLAGLAAAFAGVSGGFGASLLPGPLDPMLAGFTQEAARLVDPSITVGPLANIAFMASSSLLIVMVGTWVTERWVEPRLGPYTATTETIAPLAPIERRGLRIAGAIAIGWCGLLVYGWVPDDGILRDPANPAWFASPVLSGIVAVIFCMLASMGLAYGISTGRFRSGDDVVHSMERALAGVALYVVLAFFTSQFVACFNASNLGLVLAIRGAQWLDASGIGVLGMLTGFILMTVVLDLFIGSASAKWAFLSVMCVPMLMLTGIAPDVTQAAYRIGDSVANIITPLMPYFPMIVAFCRQYQRDAGIGTVMALMLPYSLSFFVAWTAWFLVWVAIGWPMGI